jgi:gamma-glutamyltranspeptidase/glutathione hydrolase
LALLMTGGVLAGCGKPFDLPDDSGLEARAEGAFGIAFADEPQAALIGRDVLANGGTAADAATAMYFAMAVTLPSAASLGGGGVCLVFSPPERAVLVLDFLSRPPAVVPADADRPTAVPGNVRGFYALQVRYGRERWSELVTPAETLARFGMPVSRALAQEIRPVERALAADPAFRRVFAGDAADPGALAGEGTRVTQLDLATMLARIRSEGPAGFYAGTGAGALVEGVRAAGGSLDRADLQAYLPAWRSPIVVTGGGGAAFFPAPPPQAGVIEGQMWAFLSAADRFADSPAVDRNAMLADAGLRAFADAGTWGGVQVEDAQALVSRARIAELLAGPAPQATRQGGTPRQENPSAAGLIAVDASGLAVACSVTLNSLFGTGRIAPGTGIVLASLPGTGGRGAAMLGPMVVTSSNLRAFSLAATASGGVSAPQALIGVAARTLLARQPLSEAMAAGRVLAMPETERLFVEEGMSAADVDALRRAWPVALTGPLGRVGAVHCGQMLPEAPDSCQAAADPRGFGLATTTN